jgi:hypothetical protein
MSQRPKSKEQTFSDLRGGLEDVPQFHTHLVNIALPQFYTPQQGYVPVPLPSRFNTDFRTEHTPMPIEVAGRISLPLRVFHSGFLNNNQSYANF